MKDTIINNLDNILKTELEDIYDDFMTEMQYSNTVISGSIILQAYYNEKWKNSDIDIYIYDHFFHAEIRLKKED